ncbi:unnamed protein product, partial [Meganyctiphanes norvegica]
TGNMASNRRVYLTRRPGEDKPPSDDCFGIENCDIEDIGNGHVKVKALYLSVDPYMRCRMNEDSGVEYVKSWNIGGTITSQGIGEVLESNSNKFKKGDVIISESLDTEWKDIFTLNESQGRLLELPPGTSPSWALGALGMPGLSAALGLIKKAEIKGGETMVVSGAAGAVGNVAGQLAKSMGVKRVIGICGTDEKCNLLKTIGFDDVINYKTANVADVLNEICSGQVDIYFDNVGGSVSDAVIGEMVKGGRVVLCGQISAYNQTGEYPPPLPTSTKEKLSSLEIKRERFLVLDYMEDFEKTLGLLAQKVLQGEIIVKETTITGLENAGLAFVSMMKGGNIGKMIVKCQK